MKNFIKQQKQGVFILGVSISFLLQLMVITCMGSVQKPNGYSTDPCETGNPITKLPLHDGSYLSQYLEKICTQNKIRFDLGVIDMAADKMLLVDVPVPVYRKIRDRWRLLYDDVNIDDVWVTGGGIMVEIDCRGAGLIRCRVPKNNNYFLDKAEEEAIEFLEDYCDSQRENGYMKGEYTKRVIVNGENRTRVYHLTWNTDSDESINVLITRVYVN